MATKTWTDATMTLVIANGHVGSDWELVVKPAWITADSMNGASGTVVYTTPAGSQDLFLVFGLLDDDATVPLVITMNTIQIQFNYAAVTLNGTTEIGDSLNPVSLGAGGGSGAFNATSSALTYLGGTDRTTMFSAAVGWVFTSTSVSTQESVTISGFTVTIDYSTPTTPEVTSITPSSGSVSGGQAVTITGVGFTGATSVEFGGTAVVFTPTSDTSGTATTPVHLSGVVDVEVIGVGTLTDGYTYTVETIQLPPMPTRTPMTQGGVKRGR